MNITCQPGQALHIDAHTSPTAGINTLIVTRNGVDMTVSFAGPAYLGLPEPEAVAWYTNAPVTIECHLAPLAAGSAAVVPSVAAADPLPFTGGYELPALLLGGAVLAVGMASLCGARRMARA